MTERGHKNKLVKSKRDSTIKQWSIAEKKTGAESMLNN